MLTLDIYDFANELYVHNISLDKMQTKADATTSNKLIIIWNFAIQNSNRISFDRTRHVNMQKCHRLLFCIIIVFDFDWLGLASRTYVRFSMQQIFASSRQACDLSHAIWPLNSQFKNLKFERIVLSTETNKQKDMTKMMENKISVHCEIET